MVYDDDVLGRGSCAQKLYPIIQVISKLLLASVHSKNPNDQTLFSHQGQHSEEDHGGDFISEARDWAGELISAQTMMGKILVMIIIIHSIALYYISLLSGLGTNY